jgi:hypothetical protein
MLVNVDLTVTRQARHRPVLSLDEAFRRAEFPYRGISPEQSEVPIFVIHQHSLSVLRPAKTRTTSARRCYRFLPTSGHYKTISFR